MKQLFKILALWLCATSSIALPTESYQDLIKSSAQQVHQVCIEKLSTDEIISIVDMLLLSYQIVQASVTMSQARLTMQKELLNIVTLSINDNFDVHIQAENNDLTNIKQAIELIEQSQEQIKSAYGKLKKFGPIVINIDPCIIQMFIANFKNVTLTWAKNQHTTIAEYDLLQDEIMKSMQAFAPIKSVFNNIASSKTIDQSQLLHGTNNLTDMYSNIEDVVAHLTHIRQKSLANFNEILIAYFKSHYQILYNHLHHKAALKFAISTIENHQFPDPEKHFFSL